MSKILPLLYLGRSISTNSAHSSYDNQSIKRKNNPRMTIYVIRSFLQVGFRFQHQLINLVWLSVDFLHLAEANLVPRANLKKYKSIFSFPIIAKIHAGVKVELKPHIYFSVA